MPPRLRASALIFMGLLIGSTVATTAAQEPTAEPSGLAALCVANAPDEATLADCLLMVHSVLEPDTPAAPPTPMADLRDGVFAPLDMQPFGKRWGWRPVAPATGALLQTGKKKGAKHAQEMAGEMADQLRAFLVGATPDACSLPFYARAWDLVHALRSYEAGTKKAAKLVGQSMGALWRAENGFMADEYYWRDRLEVLRDAALADRKGLLRNVRDAFREEAQKLQDIGSQRCYADAYDQLGDALDLLDSGVGHVLAGPKSGGMAGIDAATLSLVSYFEVDRRSREWTAGRTELRCVQEMARCLRELHEGRWPKWRVRRR